MSTRHTLLELFDAALRAVAGDACVARALHGMGPRPVALFAIGKAASAMSRGAYSVLGDRIRQALLITKDGHVDPDVARCANLHVMESAHPVPDERSLAAGAALERALRTLDADLLPVFLVSGGSSSLVESLRPGATLEALRALNERGLSAGWDIAHFNRERGALSTLKGGGVARLLNGREALALFVSDVPGDDPEVIGSGLLGGAADAVRRQVVANVEAAVQAVVDAAAARGLELARAMRRFDGNAIDTGAAFVAALRDAPADGLVWGGESTVALPRIHGRGGRNTHVALAAARLLRPGERLTILAAGTDGTDGPTDDAGAIVDAGTLERAELGGVDVERAYRDFDSGTALEASGDLVHTGPTGTNVGDILIGLRDAARGRVL